MELSLKSTASLNNGQKMPLLGIRVYRIPDTNDVYNCVRDALDLGYRLIDTARIYCNEKAVGRAIADSGIPREEIFVTTKLWVTDYADPRKAILESLERLQLDYVDLYLLHWPVKGYEETYLKLEELQKEGLCRSIGVANFKIHHIESLMEHGASSYPQVSQTEIHPLNTEEELIGWCRHRKITMEAYSPLGSEGRLLLDDPRLIGMCDHYKAAPSQILLRWCIQRGIVAIPKAVTRQWLEQNTKLYDFDISNSDIETISEMNFNDRRNYDPDRIDERPSWLYPKITSEE
ncbi:MAG: aldo/keto reductase [Succinivibrio sp.]